MSDTCSICGAPGQHWTRRAGRELRRCPSCRFAWVPDGVLRTERGVSIYEDEAGALFASQADYYDDSGASDAAVAKLEWVTRFSPRGGRLLDIGANIGHFVAEARRSYDAAGIEPSPAAVRLAQARGCTEVMVASIYDPIARFAERFDAITMFDVLEHLPDPRLALEQCRRWLVPGGRLFITTPDSGSMVARLLGTRWHYLDLEQHISIFSATNLERLLADCGFMMLSRRTVGRRYRCSYIERRLGELGRENSFLRLAHAAVLPLRLVPDRHLSINLGDVCGVVAEGR